MTAIPHRIHWAVAQLSPRPTDRILEIGCGPGHAVRLLCGYLTHGSITAIDRSALQVARARANNASCVASGRARIEQLALDTAASGLGEHAFAKVFAVNVNAFWTDPVPSFAALARLLRPRGRAYLVYEPPSAASVGRLARTLKQLASDTGFAIEGVRSERFEKGAGLCIIALPIEPRA